MSQTHRAPQCSRIAQRTPTPPTGGGEWARGRTGPDAYRDGRRGARSRVARKSGADAGAEAEANGDSAHAMRLRKLRKGAFRGGGYVPVLVPVGALEEPDGVSEEGGDDR